MSFDFTRLPVANSLNRKKNTGERCWLCRDGEGAVDAWGNKCICDKFGISHDYIVAVFTVMWVQNISTDSKIEPTYYYDTWKWKNEKETSVKDACDEILATIGDYSIPPDSTFALSGSGLDGDHRDTCSEISLDFKPHCGHYKGPVGLTQCISRGRYLVMNAQKPPVVLEEPECPHYKPRGKGFSHAGRGKKGKKK